MERNLHLLLKSYQDKELDEEFIESAFAELMEDDRELHLFVSELEIKNIKSLGNYGLENGKVTINMEALRKIDDVPWIKGGYTNPKIFALSTINHELEHARQVRKLYEGRKDIESTVIGYSLKRYAIAHHLAYSSMTDMERALFCLKKIENYYYDPGERLCEIKSWKKLVNLLKNNRNTKDLLLARGKLYESYVRGYDDNRYYLDAPTYKYLINTGLYQDYANLLRRVKEHDYSLNTRLTCGLPITYKEKDEDTSYKVKVKKIPRNI